jgi:RNA polymerase sigma factor (sigma-70 family)
VAAFRNLTLEQRLIRDRMLVSAIKGGNMSAFEELYFAYHPLIKRIVERVARRATQLRSDLYQIAKEVIFEYVATYDGSTLFFSYVGKPIHGACYRYYQKNARVVCAPVNNWYLPCCISVDSSATRSENDERLVLVDESIAERERERLVTHIAKSLLLLVPVRVRWMMRLYFWEELTFEEIGQRQSIPISRERVRQLIEAELSNLRRQIKFDYTGSDADLRYLGLWVSNALKQAA